MQQVFEEVLRQFADDRRRTVGRRVESIAGRDRWCRAVSTLEAMTRLMLLQLGCTAVLLALGLHTLTNHQ